VNKAASAGFFHLFAISICDKVTAANAGLSCVIPMGATGNTMQLEFPTIAFAALAVTLAVTPLAAAPGAQAPPNATPLVRVQGNYYGNYGYGLGLGYGYDYKPACPTNYHYDCWNDPYGYRHCGCLLNRW
jgi:hypothetical protein